MHSNALETLLPYLEQEKADLVYSNCNIIDENGTCIKAGVDNTRRHNRMQPKRVFRKCVVGPCFLYKDIVHKTINGYDENFKLASDYDFWMRVYNQGFVMKHLNKTLYDYRMHKDNLTSLFNKKLHRETVKVLLKNIPKANLSNIKKACYLMKGFLRSKWLPEKK